MGAQDTAPPKKWTYVYKDANFKYLRFMQEAVGSQF